MRKILSAAVVAAAFTALLTAAPASAASGRVVVFETEMQALTVYENPEGCHKLPPAAHVLANETTHEVHIYGDSLCLTPSLTVQPGYGSHVAAGSGSFSV